MRPSFASQGNPNWRADAGFSVEKLGIGHIAIGTGNRALRAGNRESGIGNRESGNEITKNQGFKVRPGKETVNRLFAHCFLRSPVGGRHQPERAGWRSPSPLLRVGGRFATKSARPIDSGDLAFLLKTGTLPITMFVVRMTGSMRALAASGNSHDFAIGGCPSEVRGSIFGSEGCLEICLPANPPMPPSPRFPARCKKRLERDREPCHFPGSPSSIG